MSNLTKLLTGLSLALSLTACPSSTPIQPAAGTPVPPPTSPAPNNSEVSLPTPSSEPQRPATDPSPNTVSPSAPTTEPSSGASTPPDFTVPANAAEIRVAVNNRFLNNMGETAILSVQLLDTNGQVINSDGFPFRFSSNNPLDFSVNDQGLITALREFGYADITVSLQGSNLSAVQSISVASGGGSFSSGGSSGGGGSTSSGQSVTGNVMFENLEQPD